MAKKNKIISPAKAFPRNSEPKERQTIKSDCANCNYASHGFICYGANGTCLKDWLKSAQNGENYVKC
jgi:hypothetical protein